MTPFIAISLAVFVLTGPATITIAVLCACVVSAGGPQEGEMDLARFIKKDV